MSLPRKPSLSRHLRDAKIKRRLSVAEVAEQVGVSQSSIYFWETDHCRPRAANLSALCKVSEIADPGDTGDGCWVRLLLRLISLLRGMYKTQRSSVLAHAVTRQRQEGW